MRVLKLAVLIAAAAIAACKSPTQPEPVVTPVPLTLTGRWWGTLAVTSGHCSSTVEIMTDFTQSGTSLTGTSHVGAGTFTCGRDVTPSEPNDRAVQITGSARDGSVTFLYGEITMTGTYGGTRLEATDPYEEGVFTWKQTRQQ